MPWLALGATTRELHDGDFVVGSGTDADWRVTSADLAPRHFVVRLRGESLSVHLASLDNVAVVNGRQLAGTHVPVGDGETILAGSGRFEFSVETPRAGAVAEPSVRQAFLIDDSGKLAHPLRGRSTAIGRDASNGIVVRDPTASRFHAEVRREAGGFAIRSLGATGTLLNGSPLDRPTILAKDDVVEIAFTRFRFTHDALSEGLSLAPPHSAQNDEAGRRPTIESAEGVLVGDDNDAGRDTRRVQLLVGLGVALVAVLWWTLAR